MDERIAVQHLQPCGIACRQGNIAAQHITGRNAQHSTHPFAAAQKAVARGLAHAGTRA